MRSRADHQRPRRGRPWWLRPRGRAAVVLLVLGLLALVGRMIALVETDWLWFREVGQERGYWTIIASRWVAGIAFGLATTGLLLANLRMVVRAAPRRPSRSVRRGLVPACAAVAAGAGVFVTLEVGHATWQQLLLWRHRGDFGVTDPLFHRDAGFYVFTLPVEQKVTAWLLLTLGLALAVAIAGHAATGAIRLRPPPVSANRGAHRHVLLLGAALLLVLAWQHRLRQFGLVLPHEDGMANGAGYTDIHVRLPWMRALVVMMALGAAALVYAAVRLSRAIPAVVVVVVVAAELLNPAMLSSVVQRVFVDPQTLSRERPYLADSIRMTRLAYGLDRVAERADVAGGVVSEEELAANRDVLEDLSLWDEDVLRREIDQQQSLGSYYRFRSVTTDRYRVAGGERRTVLLAARELDLRRLNRDGRTWANDHLAYTHGYGVVAVPAGGVDAAGKPTFLNAGFGQGEGATLVRQPRVYFGEQPRLAQPWVIADSHRDEVEQPAPGDAPETPYHYDDRGGIGLGRVVHRALFALRFGDLNVLLSRTLTAGSRIVLHRDVSDRLRTLAPFLTWEPDPDVVVLEGRIVYVTHGYTTSDTFPYSERTSLGHRRVNYIRAAVDATVDAASGAVTMYARVGEDPILHAWASAFPTLFTPSEEMPAELRTHLRYPGALFDLQARMWETYHATDVDRYYTNADALQRPPDVSGAVQSVGTVANRVSRAAGAAAPEILLARLPGEQRRRFVLATPFTPHNQENMSSWLAGSVDWAGSPQLTELSLPRSRAVLGPSQAARQIFAAPGIGERLRLLNQETTDLRDRAVNTVQLGRLRVVPIGDGFLYAQPFYVTSQATGVTRLRLVAVHLNGQVGYGPTLGEALDRARAAQPSATG